MLSLHPEITLVSIVLNMLMYKNSSVLLVILCPQLTSKNTLKISPAELTTSGRDMFTITDMQLKNPDSIWCYNNHIQLCREYHPLEIQTNLPFTITIPPFYCQPTLGMSPIISCNRDVTQM